jgi:hypothetical protein
MLPPNCFVALNRFTVLVLLYSLLSDMDPRRAKSPQSVSRTKAVLHSLTVAYTAVRLIAFAQGYNVKPQPRNLCHDMASLIPLASRRNGARMLLGVVCTILRWYIIGAGTFAIGLLCLIQTISVLVKAFDDVTLGRTMIDEVHKTTPFLACQLCSKAAVWQLRPVIVSKNQN